MRRVVSTVAQRTLALFPGALGDLLCCWPALEGLRNRGAVLTLAAREAWFAALPENAVTALSIERREIADLFGTVPLRRATRELFAGFARVESWTGYGDANVARRLAELSLGGASVHPFRDLRPAEHASEYYARCVGVAPVVRRLPVRPPAAEWADALWRRHALGDDVLAIHPGSGSARKNWQGMAELAERWRARGAGVVAIAGPAEADQPPPLRDAVLVRDEPLDRVAAALARAARYLGNDSGISHLAGMVGARGLALFGPTDPVAWRPLGAGIRVLAAPHACDRCGADRFCAHRLPVDAVLAALSQSAE